MDGKPTELGSGFAAALVCGHKGELCATQLSPELVLRAVSPLHQVVGSDGKLWSSASLVSPCNGSLALIPFWHSLYFQALPCPQKTLTWLKQVSSESQHLPPHRICAGA